MNFALTLADRATRLGWNDRTAFHEPGRDWSHGEVHDTAARLAGVLASQGVRRGDHVLLALPDSAAWALAFLATARLGAVAVTVNPELTENEHTRLAADCRPALTVCDEDLSSRFPGAVGTAGKLLHAARGAPPAPAASVPSDAPLYVQYTSGTTGEPKGVVHRHRDPAHYHLSAGEGVLGAGPDDVSLSVSRLFFAYGFGNAFVFPLFSGGSAVLLPRRPAPAEVAAACERHGVTLLYGVPTFYARLAAEADGAALRSVRAAVCAGEALRPAVAEKAAALLGRPLLDQIGSTEAGHAFCSNTVHDQRPGTLGRPVPGYALRLADEHGRPVPDGSEGRLWVGGPTLMAGYLGKPERTSEVLSGGWLSTGDLAVRNPDGTFVHRGRADDIEMVGGISVAPHEIEEALMEHPGVLEAAVVSRPDARGATSLHAFVVPREGGTAGRPGAEELRRGLSGRLAPFKVPRDVEFVAELPRTPTGKLRRFLLRTAPAGPDPRPERPRG